jgi:hypothetical protein
MDSKRKVFGIGFQKTGTTTLGVIFDKLGYRVAGYDQFRHLANRETLTFKEVEALAIEVAQSHDAAKDSPWSILYQSLDQAFPGSKFIHVVRNSDAWIKSAVNDFGDHPNAMREVIYGSRYPIGNEAAWLERYERHNKEVAEYFENRPDDFLAIQLENEGINFEAVCTFLGEKVVGAGSPRANTRFRKKLKTIWRRAVRKQ